MNIKSNDSVFPSYKGIQRQIQERYAKQYQQKINTLKDRLATMQANHHFDKDHQKIQQSIIALSSQNRQHNSHHKDILIIQNDKKSNYINGNKNGQSLNYYIEDDGEEDSNYQTYLKFKKKALERDLQQQERNRDSFNHQQKKKQKEDQQFFFKKLYQSEQDKSSMVGRMSSSQKKFKAKNGRPIFNYKQAKQNSGNFLKSIESGHFKTKINKKDTQKQRGERTSKKVIQIEAQIAEFQKNRRYLTDNYLQILKKLEGTNIVKWRILNADRCEQPQKINY